jgi:hypothetical protein
MTRWTLFITLMTLALTCAGVSTKAEQKITCADICTLYCKFNDDATNGCFKACADPQRCRVRAEYFGHECRSWCEKNKRGAARDKCVRECPER